MGTGYICRTTEAAYRRSELKDTPSKGKPKWKLTIIENLQTLN